MVSFTKGTAEETMLTETAVSVNSLCQHDNTSTERYTNEKKHVKETYSHFLSQRLQLHTRILSSSRDACGCTLFCVRHECMPIETERG